jgi:hypothetical protein
MVRQIPVVQIGNSDLVSIYYFGYGAGLREAASLGAWKGLRWVRALKSVPRGPDQIFPKNSAMNALATLANLAALTRTERQRVRSAASGIIFLRVHKAMTANKTSITALNHSGIRLEQ